MIAEHDTNIVYISGLLPEDFPDVADALKAALGTALRTIPGTKDIWCRDYMPIQLASDRFIQFRYDPDYLKNDRDLRTEDAASLLDLTKEAVRSDLVIDGGNVVRWNDTAILTEKLFDENIGTEADIEKKLKAQLEVDRVVVIPLEPEDNIGHSDGMVRFVDETTVLVNDYAVENPAFGKKLSKALKGFRIIPFPYCPTYKPGPDPDIWPATGCYINFLQTRDIICVPAFGLPVDQNAVEILQKQFPQFRVISVACARLAQEGGVLNCVTWNVRED